MTTIRNTHLVSIPREETSSPATGSRRPRVKDRPDVGFDRETSNARRLFEQTRLKVESERSQKIAALKEAVKNGTYRPNLQVVAERLAGELIVERDD
jgi:anti-sigma28 factor (negative regulator of flagellin synthesis)